MYTQSICLLCAMCYVYVCGGYVFVFVYALSRVFILHIYIYIYIDVSSMRYWCVLYSPLVAV